MLSFLEHLLSQDLSATRALHIFIHHLLIHIHNTHTYILKMHMSVYTHLTEELVGDGLIADAVGHQGSLEEEPQGELWLVLRQSIDGLETELEYLLTLHQPTLVLQTREFTALIYLILGYTHSAM